MDYKEIDLAGVNGGALVELFDVELKKVLENIGDPNTKAEAVREITLKVKFVPTEDRQRGLSTVSASSKLAPIQPHVSFLQFVTDGRTVKAYGTEVKQQDLGLGEGSGDKKIIDMNGGKK